MDSQMFETSFSEDREQAFQFKSVFRYSRLPGAEEDRDERPEDQIQWHPIANLFRSFMILAMYGVFLLTLPLSVWFCVKRVKALERCIVYRLGKRLPIRGPGFMILLPCIDTVDIIDLKPQRVTVVESENILTSDGSIVEIKSFDVEISVSNALRTFTQLKDSRYNVEQFVKISFMNMLGSNHVEDIERKLEYILKLFVENCNSYINNWGWTLTVADTPKVKVIQRAEPRNPVLSALKSYFGIKEPDAAAALKMNGVPNGGFVKSDSDADRVIKALQKLANKHSSLNIFGYPHITIAVCIRETHHTEVYKFVAKSGELAKHNLDEGEKIHLTITANTTSDLFEFLEKENTSKVEIKTDFA